MKRAWIEKGVIHTFRHAFVSMCANNNVPPMQVAQWVGHSSLEMVLRYYNLSDEESLRPIQKIPVKVGDEKLAFSLILAQ